MVERVRPSTAAPSGYNGPGKDAYLEALGKHLELRFDIMRSMSKSAHNLAAWERKGGDKKDVLDGCTLSKLSPAERQQEAARVSRVWSWHGIATEEQEGQWSFVAELDKPTPDIQGAGGHPIGSLPSLGLVKFDGYRSGKEGSLALADNPWPDDTREREVWDEAFGLGVEDRPVPKVRAIEADAVDTSREKPKRGRAPKALPAPPVVPEDEETGETVH